MTLSTSHAWQETQAIVRRDGSLLFPIAFALMALPGIAFRFFAPIDPLGGAQPTEPGAWMLWFFPVLLLTLLGALAVTLLALRSGTSVGEALGVAARRFWVPLVASMLIGLAAGLASVPLMALGVLAGRAGSAVVLLLLIVVGVMVSVRLSLIYPVAVAEPVGPVDAIRRSWSLTAGQFWRLLFFLLIAIVVAVVVSIAVAVVGGVLVGLASGGGMPERGSVGALALLLIGGVLNAVISVFLLVMLARIYVALAGRGRSAA